MWTLIIIVALYKFFTYRGRGSAAKNKAKQPVKPKSIKIPSDVDRLQASAILRANDETIQAMLDKVDDYFRKYKLAKTQLLEAEKQLKIYQKSGEQKQIDKQVKLIDTLKSRVADNNLRYYQLQAKIEALELSQNKTASKYFISRR